MPRLTDEQKRENKRESILQRLKCLRILKAKNVVASDFQRMIRLEYAAAHDGWLDCVTCDARYRWDDGNRFDGGHFIGGRRASVIFAESPTPNCFPQCKKCNNFHSGRPDRYVAFMVDSYGEQAVEELEALSRQDHKFTHEQLADLMLYFRDRIKSAERKLK